MSDQRPNEQAGCPFHEDVPFWPTKRGYPLDPPPASRHWQKEEPIKKVRIWSGQEAWLVTRYEDVKALMNNPNLSSDGSKPGFPGQTPGQAIGRSKYRNIISMDPPEHTKQRRMLTAEFTIKRVNELKPKIKSIAEDLVDKMIAKAESGEQADLVTDLCWPLPTLVICGLLGVPYEEHDYFQESADVLTSNLSPMDEVERVTEDFCGRYLPELVQRKVDNPQDDLLSRLVQQQMIPGHMTHHEMVSLSRLLLIAGHETTANTLSASLWALLANPEEMKKLTDDPSRIEPATEELLRYVDATQGGRRRVALADIEIGGVTIRKGDGIIGFNPSANRDPERWDNPDKLDLDRDARGHVAFGFGMHQCLGQPIARAEIQSALEALFSRLPNVQLAVPFEDVTFDEERFIFRVDTLPVTW